MTATPTERRTAWDALQAQLQSQLLASAEHARFRESEWKAVKVASETGEHGRGDLPDPRRMAREWEATAWAAQRLVDGLLNMEPPAIPTDHALGQDAIPMPGEADRG